MLTAALKSAPAMKAGIIKGEKSPEATDGTVLFGDFLQRAGGLKVGEDGALEAVGEKKTDESGQDVLLAAVCMINPADLSALAPLLTEAQNGTAPSAETAGLTGSPAVSISANPDAMKAPVLQDKPETLKPAETLKPQIEQEISEKVTPPTTDGVQKAAPENTKDTVQKTVTTKNQENFSEVLEKAVPLEEKSPDNTPVVKIQVTENSNETYKPVNVPSPELMEQSPTVKKLNGEEKPVLEKPVSENPKAEPGVKITADSTSTPLEKSPETPKDKAFSVETKTEKGFEVLKKAEGMKEAETGIPKKDYAPKSIEEAEKTTPTEKTSPEALRLSETYMGKKTEESQTVNGDNVVSQVARFIKDAKKPEGQKLTMQLSPKELGRITVEMKMTDGKLSVVLSAESSETAKTLGERITQLKSVLSAGSVDIRSPETNAGGQSFHFSGESYSREGNKEGRRPSERDSFFIKAHEEKPEPLSERVPTGRSRLMNYLV